MNGDCSCQNDEKGSEGPMISHKDRTVKKRDPYKTYGNHLDLQRDGLIFHEIADIWSKFRMVQKPIIQFHVAAQKKGGSQKQQRSGRQHGKKYSQHSQPKSDYS